MSEEWIKEIVQNIKTKDHDVAENAAKERRRLSVIDQKGPIFWRSFADFLRKFIEEIRAGLEGDVTQGDLSFAFQPPANNQITINKSAFPYINFTATPNFTEQPSHMSYLTMNPEAIPRGPHANIPCRFEVGDRDALILQINGHSFIGPEEAAQFVIQKLFKI